MANKPRADVPHINGVITYDKATGTGTNADPYDVHGTVTIDQMATDLVVGAKSITLTLSTGAGSVPIPDTAHVVGVYPSGSHTLTPRVGLEAPEANGTATGTAAAADLKKGVPLPTLQWTYFTIAPEASRVLYAKGDAAATFDVVVISNMGLKTISMRTPGWGVPGLAGANVRYGPEILINGNFENAGTGGADIWTGWSETAGDGTLADETTVVYTGSHSLKFTRGTNTQQIIQQPTVEAAKTYKFSFATYSVTGDSVRYTLRDLTHSADIVALTATGLFNAYWQPFSLEFTTPAGCTSIRVQIVNGNTNGKTWYVANVSLKKKLAGSIQVELLPSGYYSALALGSVLYAPKAGKLAAKSTDQGLTWTDFTNVFPAACQSVFPTKDGILLASASGEIFRSADDGATWAKVFETSQGAVHTSYINTWGWGQAATGEIYAGEYGNAANCAYLWKSTDNGLTWNRIDYFIDKTDHHIHQVKVNPETGRLYVTCGDNPKHLYYSDNGGTDWTEIVADGASGYTGITFTAAARFFSDDLTPGSNRIRKTTDDAAITTVYTPAADHDNQSATIGAIQGSNEVWCSFFNELQQAGQYASIVASPNGGTNWYVILDSASGGYQFGKMAVDYRGRIPSEMSYVVVECVKNQQMMRINRKALNGGIV